MKPIPPVCSLLAALTLAVGCGPSQSDVDAAAEKRRETGRLYGEKLEDMYRPAGRFQLVHIAGGPIFKLDTATGQTWRYLAVEQTNAWPNIDGWTPVADDFFIHLKAVRKAAGQSDPQAIPFTPDTPKIDFVPDNTNDFSTDAAPVTNAFDDLIPKKQ